MKRLLAYLFLVLGLGLVFSVNANAKTNIDLSFCKKKSDNYDILYPVLTKYFAEHCTSEGGNKITYQNFLKDPQGQVNICFNTRTKFVSSRRSSCPENMGHSKVFYENGSFYYSKKQTQIAKAEPSQTQEVAEQICIEVPFNYKNIAKPIKIYKIKSKKLSYNLLNCHGVVDGYKYYVTPLTNQKIYKKLKKYANAMAVAPLNFSVNEFKTIIGTDTIYFRDVKNQVYDINYGYVLGSDKITQIAKVEPSQTQQKVLLEFCKIRSPSKLYVYSYPVLKNQSCYHHDPYSALTLNKENKVSKVSYQEYLKDPRRKEFNFDTIICMNTKVNKVWAQDNSCNKKLGQIKVFNENDSFYYNSQETQIAKTEPTVKPKKKKKVKVAKTTQEEFKPEDKDIDNDPPVIEIAEAITVDSQAYTLKGKVKDKSKIYLTIDGRQVQVKKGKFKIDRFNIDPGEVEEIKIVAIDKWNNKSEKTIKVTIDLKSTELARSFEDLKPNSVRVKTDKNKIAIIIGVEKYKNMTVCNYCNRDAKAFKAYASRALGVVPSNIISLVDSKATRGEILRAFKISLPKIAGDGGKDINIFFAGHGLASESGEDLYIIPQDGDQGLLEDTAVSRIELIKLIKKVNPKSVTMFFDTCYSGQTRGEQMLVASLRGIRIVDADNIPDNFSIFTASSSNQGSSHIEEAKHGMFSYYLMKGLEGKADNNKDKKITNGELIAYLKTNVSKEAFTQNREQDPMLSGDPDQVLMSYR